MMEISQQLREILYAVPVAIFTGDDQGIVTAWNPAAERMFGWTAADVIGRENPVWPPDLRADVARTRERVFAGESLENIERRVLRGDGTSVDVLYFAAPLRRRAGGPVFAAVELLIDLTHLKPVEQALQPSNERLRRLTDESPLAVVAIDERGLVELERQLQQSQRLEAIGRLAGGIAHDFNNLLTAMLGYAELVLATIEADHPIASDVREIKRAAERAASLSQHLLAFSRKQVLQPKVIALNAIIGNADKLLRRVIGEDIRLVLDLGEDLGAVNADPGHVEQVLVNLAVNARDAMPQGGTLTIRTANTAFDEQYVRRHVGAVPGRYSMIEVSDTGCGMTADVVARIFEPFFTTKGPGKGTGLGLSTVYGIVQQSGGYVWVTSEEGKGTTIEIHLPRTDEPLADALPGAAAATTRTGSETILLVEDDERLRDLLTTALSRQGYRVLAAADGAKALNLLRGERGHVHLILTDVVMPEMTGFDLADRARAIDPHIKLVLMSEYIDQASIRFDLAATPILKKPFSIADLGRCVRQALHG